MKDHPIENTTETIGARSSLPVPTSITKTFHEHHDSFSRFLLFFISVKGDMENWEASFLAENCSITGNKSLFFSDAYLNEWFYFRAKIGMEGTGGKSYFIQLDRSLHHHVNAHHQQKPHKRNKIVN